MEEEGQESGINAVDVAEEPRQRPTVADLPPEAVRLLPGQMRNVRDGSYVYFLCDGDECVYVGQAINLTRRVFQHSKAKDFGDVYYIEAGENPFEVERAWIKRLRPTLNRQYNYEPRTLGRVVLSPGGIEACEYCRIAFAAQEAGVKRTTLLSAVNRGDIEVVEMGCRLPLVRLADVKRWAAEERQRGPKPKE